MKILPAVFLLVLASSAHAVMREPSLEEADTLDLDPREARDFRVHQLAGEDLNDAGFYLSLLALPALGVAIANPGALGFSGPGEGYLALTCGALPVLAATMAAGNMVYAQAARYHRQRDYAISYSLLPFFACAAAGAQFVVLAVNYDRGDRDLPAALWALGLTDLFFIPALRIQFHNAENYLGQVRLRVAPRPDGVSLRLDF
jgi:hypothetical protein